MRTSQTRQKMEGQLDIYSKLVLTIIAVALSVIAVPNVTDHICQRIGMPITERNAACVSSGRIALGSDLRFLDDLAGGIHDKRHRFAAFHRLCRNAFGCRLDIFHLRIA
jgi:hypothetical protein